MVIRYSKKCLILIAVTFSLPIVRVYSNPAVQKQYSKYIEAELEKIKRNEHWIALEDANKAEVIKKVFFQDNRIKLPPEVLEKQIDLQGNEREKILNEVLTKRSAQENPIRLSTDVLKDQYNKLDNRDEFVNAHLTENSARVNPVKLDIQVLKDQYNKLDTPDEFFSHLLSEKETPLQGILTTSEPMILFFKKIQLFEALIEKQDFEKAAVVSDDITKTIQNFNPTLFFPKLFSRYFALTATHIDILSDEWNNKTSLKWEALNRLYQTDIEGFIQW